MTEWTAQGIPAVPATGTVTLVEGTAFCVCSPSGDIVHGGIDGIFFRDTRLVSRWELRVDGEPLEPLTVMSADPFSATFLGRGQPRPGKAESSLLVTRARYLGSGMREDITVHNLSNEPAGLSLDLHIESDLADLFDVKAGRIRVRGDRSITTEGHSLVISVSLFDRERGMRITADPATAGPGGLSFLVAVPARETWQTVVLVQPIVDGKQLPPRFPTHCPIKHADPVRRLQAWQRESSTVWTQHTGLAKALERRVEPLTEEEPGKMMHELRYGVDSGILHGSPRGAAMDAASAFDGRLPEPFCGFDRSEFPEPVPYPTSCSPQAWAAASPVHLLRTPLRFGPWIPYKKAWLAPAFPPGLGDLQIANLPLADSLVSIRVSGGQAVIRDWPPDIELTQEPRPPLTSLMPSGDPE
jgi:hypothetical protein